METINISLNDYLMDSYPHSELQASGEAVGLPNGQMGNSETGHFIYVTANHNARVQNGVLADVAPTILHIMGLSQPQEMTGQCLINE